MRIEDILKLVEKETNLDVTKKTRKREYVYARSVYFKICREKTLASFREIGELVGRDHASVIHGIKVFDVLEVMKEERWLQVYKSISREVEFSVLNYLKANHVEEYHKLKYKRLKTKYNFLLTRLRQVDSGWAEKQEFKMEEG